MAMQRHGTRDSAAATIIVALLVGVMVGFASGWELSAMQYRGPAQVSVAPGSSVAANTFALPTERDGGTVRSTPVTYRAVVEAVSATGFKATVMEGVAGEPLVTLLPEKDAELVALRPATIVTEDLTGKDLSKGLPPPPKPPADPYKEEPMKLSEFAKGDVVEFSTVEPVADGSTVKVGKITWIMNLSTQARQGGTVGDGTAAPPMPPVR